VEILMKTSALPNIIREGNTPQLLTVIQGGKSHGMQTMDEALEALVRAGRIKPKDAYQRASDKAHFEKLLNAPADAL
jgi:twitching motility protein PilT